MWNRKSGRVGKQEPPREVKNLDEIKTLIDQSEALKAYARSAQLSADIQSDIAELNLRATRRLGEISARLEKAKASGNQHTGKFRSSEVTKTAALSSIGVSVQRANEAEKIASIPEEIFEAVLSSAKTEVSKAEIAEFARMDQAHQKAGRVGKQEPPRTRREDRAA